MLRRTSLLLFVLLPIAAAQDTFQVTVVAPSYDDHQALIRMPAKWGGSLTVKFRSSVQFAMDAGQKVDVRFGCTHEHATQDSAGSPHLAARLIYNGAEYEAVSWGGFKLPDHVVVLPQSDTEIPKTGLKVLIPFPDFPVEATIQVGAGGDPNSLRNLGVKKNLPARLSMDDGQAMKLWVNPFPDIGEDQEVAITDMRPLVPLRTETVVASSKKK